MRIIQLEAIRRLIKHCIARVEMNYMVLIVLVKDVKNLFVHKKSGSVISGEEVITSSRNIVFACMFVNSCDHAHCDACYAKKVESSGSSSKRRCRISK